MRTTAFEDAEGSPVAWTGANERLRYDGDAGHWVFVTGRVET